MNKDFNRCYLCGNGKDLSSFYNDCYNCVGSNSDFCPGTNFKQFLAHHGYTLKKNEHTPIIIMGFPGVGKTYLKEKLKSSGIRVLDSDGSNWYGSDFPGNYIKFIENVAQEFDIILISIDKKVREAIKKSSLMSTCAIHLCYPALNMQYIWLNRLIKCGYIEQLIDSIDKNYEDWINDIEKETQFNHIVISYEKDSLYNNIYKLNLYNLNKDAAFKLQKVR